MSINKELNSQLMQRTEENRSHVEYTHEYGFYGSVVNGDTEAVSRLLADPRNTQMYESGEYGRLSSDTVRNIRYHFVVSAALITRLCVEKGLERELAYTLSDLYISKMDVTKTAGKIISLHNEMLMDFTRRMADMPKRNVCSANVVRAMEYIYLNRNKRITTTEIAEYLNINRSYLSTVFTKETGMTVSSFILNEKIKAAENMLKFSDHSYSEIAQYLGFCTQSHFIKRFSELKGTTPRKYRKEFLRTQEEFSDTDKPT